MENMTNTTFTFQLGWKEINIGSCVCFDGTRFSVVSEEELLEEVKAFVNNVCLCGSGLVAWCFFRICYRPEVELATDQK